MSFKDQIISYLKGLNQGYASLTAIKHVLNAERSQWKDLNKTLKDLVQCGHIIKSSRRYRFNWEHRSTSSTTTSSSSFSSRPSRKKIVSSSKASSSATEVVVVNELSLDERLAQGSKTATDLTQTQFEIDTKQIQRLKVQLIDAQNSNAAFKLVKQLLRLVESSSYCLLSPSGVQRLHDMLQSISTNELTSLFSTLSKACQSRLEHIQQQQRTMIAKHNKHTRNSNNCQLAVNKIAKKVSRLASQHKSAKESERKALLAYGACRKATEVLRVAVSKMNQTLSNARKEKDAANVVLVQCTKEQNEIKQQLASINALPTANQQSSSSSSSLSSSSSSSSSSSNGYFDTIAGRDNVIFSASSSLSRRSSHGLPSDSTSQGSITEMFQSAGSSLKRKISNVYECISSMVDDSVASPPEPKSKSANKANNFRKKKREVHSYRRRKTTSTGKDPDYRPNGRKKQKRKKKRRSLPIDLVTSGDEEE